MRRRGPLQKAESMSNINAARACNEMQQAVGYFVVGAFEELCQGELVEIDFPCGPQNVLCRILGPAE
jgi:hypothetical protein